MRIPAQEGDVLGGDLDKAGTGLGQPPGEQTALAEPAGVVAVEAFLRLLRQVESVALGRVQQPIGVIHRADHRLLMVVARQAGEGPLVDELAIGLFAAGEPFAGHAFGGSHGGHRIERIGDVERAVFAAEEAGGRERLELLDFPVTFQPLADVDERRDRRVSRTADLGDPRADVRRGHGLRRNISGVPVILVPRMQDISQVGDNVRAD